MWEASEPKKLLVLNGSPKKDASTTMTVTRAFVRGMEQAGQWDTEFVNISQLHIKPCTGCLSCWGRTAGECVIRDDDMPALREKILGADVIIESYPLYFFGMPGSMKVFTDRMLGMMGTYTGQESPKNGDSFHKVRYPRQGRRFVLISSCAFTEAEDVYEALLKQYDLICGKGNYTAICCPQLKTLSDLGAGARLERYLSKFEEAGKTFAAEGTLDAQTLKKLAQPPFTHPVYKVLLDKFWSGEKGENTND